ncbi:MAG TPA: hypothetical protein VH108_11580 [Gaiellaceae bacterium]|jgi:hypothetical protein|nr:hypothetical protein [Gaiellaceae bacterium]
MRRWRADGTLWAVKYVLIAAVVALVLPAAAFAWDGTYPTGDAAGTSIHIVVSDTYPVDQALPQSWATYFGSIPHGPELSSLTLSLMPLAALESRKYCGSAALACYDPTNDTMYAAPDDQLDEPPAMEIATHEYGHHIANSRSNAPWVAEDYGTKRWSSYENICARAAAGTASPGDEGLAYSQNPGEAFAESYRVLALTDLGLTPSSWDIVDQSFYPDATALQLLQEDITSPWTGPTVHHVHGSFGNGATRTIAVQSTLDGTFLARLQAPSQARLKLELYSGSTLVARGKTSVRFEICGQRTLTLKVRRLSGHGAFTVDVSKP